MLPVTRIAASAFTNSLDKRREKVLSRIKRKNTNAATTINRIACLAEIRDNLRKLSSSLRI